MSFLAGFKCLSFGRSRYLKKKDKIPPHELEQSILDAIDQETSL